MSGPNPGFFSTYALSDNVVNAIFPATTNVPAASITATITVFVNGFAYVPVILWFLNNTNANVDMYINGLLYLTAFTGIDIPFVLNLKTSGVVCPQGTTISLSSGGAPTTGHFQIGSVCSS